MIFYTNNVVDSYRKESQKLQMNKTPGEECYSFNKRQTLYVKWYPKTTVIEGPKWILI